MTVYTWPTGDSAFALKSQTWGALHNSRVNTSEHNGATQGISLPGARRTLTLEVPEQTYAERARLAAFFERLDGPENRVAIWDLARPTPPGLTGSPTVSGAVSQFAETLNIAGAIYAGDSLVRRTQDFGDASWAKTASSVTVNAATAPDGATTADQFLETAVAGAHFMFGQSAAYSVGAVYTSSIHAKASTSSKLGLFLPSAAFPSTGRHGWFDLAGGAVGGAQSGVTAQITNVGSGWYRCSISALCTVTASASGGLYLTQGGFGDAYLGVVTNGVYIWGAKVEQSSAATAYTQPTVTQGDWLALVTSAGNQLVKCMNTVVADSSDQLTGVEIRHALRGSVASGSAVGIVQPTGLYVQRNPDQVLMPRGGRGMCPATSIDLVEVFA